MPKTVLRIGVVARSWPPANQWAVRTLRPIAVLDALPALAPGALMANIDGVETRYLGDHACTFHHGETAHYRTNLASVRPSVWVAMNADRVILVTPDPYEGEALAGDPAREVEAVPMPATVQAAVADFIARHHIEVPFEKRRRTPATGQDDADPRAPRILPADQKWGKR